MEIHWSDTRADKKAKGKFNEYFNTYVGSKPSELAFEAEAVSAKDPTPWLKAAFPPKPGPPPDVPLPDDLEAMIKLQKRNGAWAMTPQLRIQLGGFVPDPPGELPMQRWATALVITYFRRFPKHWAQTRPFVERGYDFADDYILGQARDQLPPYPCQFALDHDMVKQGLWKECESEAFKRGGFGEFTAGRPHDSNQDELARSVKELADHRKGLQKKGDMLSQHDRDLALVRRGPGPNLVFQVPSPLS
jgi:hypothetical protein